MEGDDGRTRQLLLELIGNLGEDGCFEGEPGLLVQLADEFHAAGEFDENEHDDLVALIAAHPSEAMFVAALVLRLLLRAGPVLNHGCEVTSLRLEVGVPVASITNQLIEVLSAVYAETPEQVRAELNGRIHQQAEECGENCTAMGGDRECTCMIPLFGLEPDLFVEPEDEWRGASVLEDFDDSDDDLITDDRGAPVGAPLMMSSPDVEHDSSPPSLINEPAVTDRNGGRRYH